MQGKISIILLCAYYEGRKVEIRMTKIYFPGANSGRGFFSRFSGIVPPWEKPHYTYVLKGGPGVGKNTLMKKVAQRAAAKGYTVEEFRCASDPDSFDAVRVEELGIVLLDGTAPHSIDPVLPGVADEVVDLGHFKNKSGFAERRSELDMLFADNKAHYRAAYACLGAAYTLKNEALSAAVGAVDIARLKRYLSAVLGCTKKGSARELFACSATPTGVIDHSKTYLGDDAMLFSGIVGEVAMLEAEKLLCGRQCTVGYDFTVPTLPHTIDTGEHSVAVGEGGADLAEFCQSAVPPHVEFCLAEAERLVQRAVEELAKSLSAHDRIEDIYRPYVDYDRVNHESEVLMHEIFG